jgi:hypothetical protein
MPDVEFIRELGSIPIATVALFLIYRLASNHMNALADAVEKLADAVDSLKNYLHAKDS